MYVFFLFLRFCFDTCSWLCSFVFLLRYCLFVLRFLLVCVVRCFLMIYCFVCGCGCPCDCMRNSVCVCVCAPAGDCVCVCL